jgi:hypothetical protein
LSAFSAAGLGILVGVTAVWPQMGEQGQKSRSATGAAALDRAGRHVEHAGGLGDGVALHVHEDQCGPLVGREGTERFDELAVQVVAFRRGGCGLVRLQQLLQPLGVVDR